MESHIAAAAALAVPEAVEIIIENDKSGASVRAVQAAATIVGRAAGCDIRIKSQGVEANHCLILQGPHGLQVRDLSTRRGTYVNGNRVDLATLTDGDQVQVGDHMLRVRVTGARNGPDSSADAVRVQTAAVAAQQVALFEEETRLEQRRQALERQEEQLSLHLEEKRRKLLKFSERAQEERAALLLERTAYKQTVERVSGNLTEAQRELVEQQQQVQAERRRLTVLQGKLKLRWQRQFAAERTRLALAAEEMANEQCNLKREVLQLKKEREQVERTRLQFNADYELGRRQLGQARARLHGEARLWRQRRARERAALRLRARELDAQQLAVADRLRALQAEALQHEARRRRLQDELDGLNQRIRHQRDKILDQQMEINRLDAALRDRVSPSPTLLSAEPAQPCDQTVSGIPPAEKSAGAISLLRLADSDDQEQTSDLDRLAGELVDQRLQLSEHWQRLVQAKNGWQRRRDEAMSELNGLLEPLAHEQQALAERERACRTVEEQLCSKHRELVQMRQHLLGWRARVRACEATWQGERIRLLTEMEDREKLVTRQMELLTEVRRRWAAKRREESETLRLQRAACENIRRDYARLRQDWQERFTQIEREKHALAEKTAALEQLHQEALGQSADAPAAQKRMDQIRRRWNRETGSAFRTLTREQQKLKEEMAALELRHAQLHRLADEVLAAEVRLSELHLNRDQQQTQAAAQIDRLQRDLKMVRGQRDCAAQQLANIREEIEHIARTLLEDSEPPFIPVEKAA